MPAISNQNSQIQGIFDDYAETWENAYAMYGKLNNLLSRKPQDKTITTAQYAWKESIPFVRLWDAGKGRTHQIFRDRLVSVTYHGYELTIDVGRYDRRSDQLNDPKEHMQRGINRFHQIPQKGFRDILEGVTDTVREVPLAFDGVNLFSNLDGDGNNRFGAANGNLLTVSGFTSADVYRDVFRGQEQFMRLLDPAGEIIWSGYDTKINKMHVIHPPNLNQVFNEVSKAQYLRLDSLSNTSQDNVLMGTFEVHANNYLTNPNAWYLLIEDSYWKPFILRQEADLQVFWGDMTNSDRSRQHNLETLFADQRVGFGIHAPWTIIKFTA